MALNVPIPLVFGTGAGQIMAGNDVRVGRLGGLVPVANKGLYYDAAGAPQLEDYLRDQSFNIGVTAAVVGDMTVAYTTQACIFDKRGKNVDIFGAPSFTLTYTSTAWVASTAVTLATRRTNGGNVYEVTTAGTTAASGGPTGTGTGITDGTAVWKYISAATSGALSFTGLPFAADGAAPRAFIPIVPSSVLIFPNNGTSLFMATNGGLNTAGVLASKSAAGAQASQVSSTQFGPGLLHTLPFSGRYKAAA